MAINKCYLSGRLTKDPELRYTQSGTAVCQFTLAVDDIPRDGETKTHFLNCVIWQKRAEVIAKHVKKGDQLFIEARVQTRSYDKDGQKVYVTEFVINDFDFGKQSGGGSNSNNSNGGNRNNSNYIPDNPFASDQKPIDISDDDLPF